MPWTLSFDVDLTHDAPPRETPAFAGVSCLEFREEPAQKDGKSRSDQIDDCCVNEKNRVHTLSFASVVQPASLITI